VRPSSRIPVHRPYGGLYGETAVGGQPAASAGEDEAHRFQDRPCYLFNRSLPPAFDDRHCSHCRHYLTSRCPHIDEFIDDVEDLTGE
jgi:hypothetical protein